MKKADNQKKIKSLAFVLIMMFLPVTILLILMSLIRSETVPPDWAIALLIVVLFGSFINACIIRKKDLRTPERQHNLTEYFKVQFIIYLIYIILISSLDILVNTCKVPPVDYNLLPNVLVHTIGYIFALTLLWLICIHLLLKRYLEDDCNGKVTWKSNINSKISIYIFLLILFVLMLFGLRTVLLNVHSYYDTGYSRYGDIASFMCVFGGFLGFGLILCVQNGSNFIPFKFLNGIVVKILDFDANERMKKEK